MNSYDDRIYEKSVESRYIHCPVCGSKDYQMRICQKCGYDSALDYTRFLTLDLLEKGSHNSYQSYDAMYKDAEYEKLKQNISKQKQEITELKNSQIQMTERYSLLQKEMTEQAKMLSQLNKYIKEIYDSNQEIPQKIASDKTGAEDTEASPKSSTATAGRTFDFANVTVGSTIKYGHYRQSADGKQKDSIEWLVLERKSDRILVISKKILDCQQLHIYRDEKVRWGTCTLRGWLNEDFKQEAFTAAEQEKILITDVDDKKNPDYGTFGDRNTWDQIFLLSIEEAERYFHSDKERQCTATDYIRNKGRIYVNRESGNSWWWLRSVGSEGGLASFVRHSGDVYSHGLVRNVNIGVRPALYISLES